jgi:hypothetical protein
MNNKLYVGNLAYGTMEHSSERRSRLTVKLFQQRW